MGFDHVTLWLGIMCSTTAPGGIMIVRAGPARYFLFHICAEKHTLPVSKIIVFSNLKTKGQWMRNILKKTSPLHARSPSIFVAMLFLSFFETPRMIKLFFGHVLSQHDTFYKPNMKELWCHWIRGPPGRCRKCDFLSHISLVMQKIVWWMLIEISLPYCAQSFRREHLLSHLESTLNVRHN